jgi:hypothetical protein
MPDPTAPERLVEIRANDQLSRELRGDGWDDNTTDAEIDRRDLLAAFDGVLQIVSDWCVEANNVGGVDAGDLAWRLEEAGYPLPEES